MFLTIFTPIYNRAYCISRLYESLCRQTCKDFEWLVVDDGSTDNIDELMERFIAERQIVIRYFTQPNGGKHRAINRGVKEAHGELFFIVDSDDYLTDNAVRFIVKEAAAIIDDKGFAGLSGIDQTVDGRILSQMPSDTPIDATSLDIRYKFHVVGDMAEVFKTDIFRQFPFPEIDGEKFCPEALVWRRIAAAGYKLRYFPMVTKIVEYLPDGLTSSIVKVRMKSPVAACIYYAELSSMAVSLSERVKAAINYWRFRFCQSTAHTRIDWLWLWLLPIGLVLHLKDSLVTAK